MRMIPVERRKKVLDASLDFRPINPNFSAIFLVLIYSLSCGAPPFLSESEHNVQRHQIKSGAGSVRNGYHTLLRPGNMPYRSLSSQLPSLLALPLP